MIWAKSNQVGKLVRATIGNRCDVMDLDIELETANDALVIVPQQNLFADKPPFTTLPVAIQVVLFREVCSQAKAIAEVPFFHLARILPEFLPAIRALYGDLVFATRRGSKSLPLSVALIAAACAPVMARPCFKGRTANWAASCFLAATVIAIVLATMLVEIDVLILPTWVFVAGNDLTTTASAVDNGWAIICNPFRHGDLLSLSIITC